MKPLIVIILSFLTLNACNKGKEMEYIDRSVSILYTDKNGNDLLNPDTENHIDSADIDIYYLIDGKPVIEYRTITRPENFWIHSRTGKYYLFVDLSDHMIDNISETYIVLGDDTDTVRCRYHVTDGGYWPEEIWYNGELKIGLEDDWSNGIDVIK